MAAEGAPDADRDDLFRRVAAATSLSDARTLRRLRADLTRGAEGAKSSRERGLYEGLLGIVRAVEETDGPGRGLAPQSAPIEPGSLAARMLLEIAGGVRGANGDLADRLDTDPWQISRSGKRLRELGLASRTRSGRLNRWSLTSAGEAEAARMRNGSR